MNSSSKSLYVQELETAYAAEEHAVCQYNQSTLNAPSP